MRDPVHHKIRRHVKKHKKHYIRFVAFFSFLLIFAIIEDTIVALATGAPLAVYTLTIILIVSLIFTAIAEYTEKLFEKEAEDIARFVKKEEPKVEKLIRKEEKTIGRELKRI